jgi:hypothetical protein
MTDLVASRCPKTIASISDSAKDTGELGLYEDGLPDKSDETGSSVSAEKIAYFAESRFD